MLLSDWLLSIFHCTSCLFLGFLQWVLTMWVAAAAAASRGTLPVVGASSSIIWVRTRTRPSCGRCSGHLALSSTWKWSEISTLISAKASASSPCPTTRRPPWRSTAWTGTGWETKSCRCPSRPAKATSREEGGRGEGESKSQMFFFVFFVVISWAEQFLQSFQEVCVVFSPSMPCFCMTAAEMFESL